MLVALAMGSVYDLSPGQGHPEASAKSEVVRLERRGQSHFVMAVFGRQLDGAPVSIAPTKKSLLLLLSVGALLRLW